MPSARPSATATIRISSSSEPEAELTTPSSSPRRLVLPSRLSSRPSPASAAASPRRPARDASWRLGGLGLGERLLVDGLARHLVVRRRRGLRRGIVQQAALDDLLRAGVAALAHAGALADAAAQVVELRAPDVAAGGDLDLLDLRRVHRERALDADAEGLLADREGLAHAFALALDHHALEDLRAAPRALDDLEVDLDAVPGLEAGDAAQLRALEGVDDGAHGVGKTAAPGADRAGGRSNHGSGPSARCRDCSRRHSSNARVMAGEQHVGHRPAAPVGGPRVVRVLGRALERLARTTPRAPTRPRRARPAACAARCRARPSPPARRRPARSGRSRPGRCTKCSRMRSSKPS